MINEYEIFARSDDPQQAYIQQILPEKLSYAVRYVQTRSLKLDIYLIILTIRKIFTR